MEYERKKMAKKTPPVIPPETNGTDMLRDDSRHIRPRMYVDHDTSLTFPWFPHFLPGVFFAATSQETGRSPTSSFPRMENADKEQRL